MSILTKIVKQSIFISSDNLNKAYKDACELNNRNDLKGGGRSSQFEGYSYHEPRPDKWFAWVNWNYQETCKNLIDMLDVFRFDVEVNDNGDIIYLEWKGNKLGDEAELFRVLAPYISSGSYMYWSSEEGDYTWYFNNGQFIEIEESSDDHYDDGC